MGRKAFIGSELIFSDTVHQFLQVLTLSLRSKKISGEKNESEKSLAWKKFLGLKINLETLLKYTRQAGAELCQAQSKITICIEV